TGGGGGEQAPGQVGESGYPIGVGLPQVGGDFVVQAVQLAEVVAGLVGGVYGAVSVDGQPALGHLGGDQLGQPRGRTVPVHRGHARRGDRPVGQDVPQVDQAAGAQAEPAGQLPGAP